MANCLGWWYGCAKAQWDSSTNFWPWLKTQHQAAKHGYIPSQNMSNAIPNDWLCLLLDHADLHLFIIQHCQSNKSLIQKSRVLECKSHWFCFLMIILIRDTWRSNVVLPYEKHQITVEIMSNLRLFNALFYISPRGREVHEARKHHFWQPIGCW